MKKYAGFITLVGLVVLMSGFARAADSVAGQISAAIVKGDYKTVQQLVTENPGQGSDAELKLLAIANADAAKNPQQTLQVMTLSSNLSPYIDTANAGHVSVDIKKLVDKVLAASPSGSDKPAPSGYTPDETVAVLNSALTIAQSKPVLAGDPDLAPYIQAQLEQFADANDVLLAQVPLQNFAATGNDIRFYQPDFNPPSGNNHNNGSPTPDSFFVPPPTTGGSIF